MKFRVLKSIAHNIADSLASGIGLMIGVYEMDVFGEAAASAEGYIEVDFLAGTSSGGQTSDYLAEAIKAYRGALPGLCQRHGASPADFHELGARYSGAGPHREYVVTIEDREGRRTSDRYIDVPGRRVRMVDPLGRIRRG